MVVKPVVLIGFSGVGKSEVAKQLRQKHHWRAVDVDEAVEKDYGGSITNLIRVEGERRFRELETSALKAALESDAEVVATGGGIMLAECNRELLAKHAYTVWLTATERCITERVISDEDIALDKGEFSKTPLTYAL